MHRDMGSRIISMIESDITDEQRCEVKRIGLNISSNYELGTITKIGPFRSITIRGPITDELFAKLSISDIVAKLCDEWSLRILNNKYEISDDDCLINESGISDLLEKDIPERLQEYTNEADRFFVPQELDLFYTSAYLLGLRTTISKIPSLAWTCDWGRVIDLCSTIKDFDMQELPDEKKIKTSYYETTWGSEREGLFLKILDFLQSIFYARHEGNIIDLSEYHTKILKLLDYFLEDSDPAPEAIKYLNNYSDNWQKNALVPASLDSDLPNRSVSISDGLSNIEIDVNDEENKIDNPYVNAFHSIRGRAFEEFIHFIETDIAMKGDYMSEDIKGKVRTLYEKVLKKENTRAVMFLFGYHFNVIYHWDTAWSLSNINQIFNKEKEKKLLFTAAWEGLLSGYFGEKMFFEKVIQQIYLRGMQLNKKDYPMQKHLKDPDELIGERIAWAFVAHYNEFGFKHLLFINFLESNNPIRYSQFISYIGKIFISESEIFFNNKERKDFIQDNPEVKKRFCELWDWMLDNCGHRKALIEFGTWLSPEDDIFEDEWLVNRLLKTLEITDGNLSGYKLLEVLNKLGNKFPGQVIKIIRLCLLGEVDEVGGREFTMYVESGKWVELIQNIYDSPKMNAELKGKANDLISELIEKRGNVFRPLGELVK